MAKKINFLDNIKKASKKVAEKPAKKDRPQICVDDATKKNIDAYVTLKTDLKVLTADIAKVEQDIIAEIKPKFDEKGFNNNYDKSVDICGIKAKIQYVTGNKFSLNADDVEDIEEILGEDNYPECIEETHVVQLRQGVLTNEKMMQKLQKAVGDKFDDFFEAKLVLKTKPDFDRRIYTIAKTKENLADIRTLVRPFKAALKVVA